MPAMDEVTPPRQIKKTPKRPLSLKKIKNATYGHLGSGSLTPKWPWGRASPDTSNSDTTLAVDGEDTLGKRSSTSDPIGSQKNSTDSLRLNQDDINPSATESISHGPDLGRKSRDGRESIDISTEETRENGAMTVGEPNKAALKAELSPDDTLAFPEVSSVFAVDCSGSTHGKVLEVQKNAIQQISNLLSPVARSKALVLPWNDEADSVLTIDETEELYSSGGTDPTTIMRDRHHRQALLNSSLWVLLTDGEIDDNLVRDFALGIGNVGLHGTASIIICTGRTIMTPAMCNISVGKSVFAIVPDCMFLFQDVTTSKVYILQCKGRFKHVLPSTKQDIMLDHGTTWDQLPQITYEKLQSFRVPKRRDLSSNTVLLTSGKTFDLNDVYKDILDPAITNEILSNDDDLKTLLLTAATRGRKEDIKRWIKKKKLQVGDPLWVTRPDLGNRASQAMENLIDAMKGSDDSKIMVQKSMLRSAHEKNWNHLIHTISTNRENARIRDRVIADATSRLQLEDDERTCPSPRQLGPVSPTLTHSSSTYSQSPSAVSHTFSALDSPANIYGRHPNGISSGRVEVDISRRYYPRRAEAPQTSVDVVYTQGYKCNMRLYDSTSSHSNKHFVATCTLCGRTAQIMALILRKPEEDELTTNYPQPQQEAKHKYPFILGNFADVDIISSEVYCEACSVFLVRQGTSPKSDHILGALPLVSTQGKTSSMNLQLWKDTLCKVFENRFHESITLSVFLSVLYNTLDDLASVDSTENTILMRAIRWACRNLLQSIQVSRDTSTIPLGESPNPDSAISTSIPLSETIPRLVKNAIRGQGQLLTHPLEGFLILILAARDIEDESCNRESLRQLLWLRLTSHMMEAHYEAIRECGRESAKTKLFQLLHSRNPEARPGTSTQDALTRNSPIPLNSLKDTHLLLSDDLDTFQRSGALFTQASSKWGASIAVFLHYLLEYSEKGKYGNASTCFDALRKEKVLRKVFLAPEGVNPAQAADIIARIGIEGEGDAVLPIAQ